MYSVPLAIYMVPEKWVFLKKRKTKCLYKQSQDSHYKSCYIKLIFYNKTTVRCQKKKPNMSLPESDFPK